MFKLLRRYLEALSYLGDDIRFRGAVYRLHDPQKHSDSP